MNTRILRRTLIICLPLAIVVGAAAVAWFLMQQRPQFTPAPVEPPSYLVGVEVAQREPVTFIVRSQGTVAPRTSTTLVSEVSGQVTDVMPYFVNGGFFKKDDVLIRIDPRNYETALKRAELAVAKAQTKVETESALSGYARDDWQRLRDLNRTVVNPSELTLRKPQMHEVMAELESAKADLKKASDDLLRTTIHAPYDGMIREKQVDYGQYVNSGAQLAQTVAVDRAEVRLPLALNDLQYLDLPNANGGDPVPVNLEARIGASTQNWNALIVRTEGVIDPQSRVIHAVAQVEDPYGFINDGKNVLRFGTFVHASIEGRSGGRLFVIPRHAVHKGTTMWIVQEDDTIQPKEVSIVRSDENFSYISNGINEGDIYCVTPIDRPLPGMRVRVSG